MIRTLFVVAAVLLTAGPVSAGDRPRAVLELFTSQGCSSCPPADALLGELARRPDLVAITLPVDYWDYLGWRDTLAKPAFSARQRAYAHGRGDGQVYTPQVVVNGEKPCIGSDRAAIERAIAKLTADRPELPVAVTLSEAGGSVIVEVAAGANGARRVEVLLFPITRSEQVAIGRGENRGRTVTYANVAHGMTRLGAWTGAPARFEAPRVAGAHGYVALLQARSGNQPGPILGAARSDGL